MRESINDEYFEWLYGLVCNRRFGEGISFRNILTRLYHTEFEYIIPRDRNRAEDGISLRRRFILINCYEDWYETVMESLDGPCSVLEMMIALAIRCEENIMDDPRMGDRTRQWFWVMMGSLGLAGMTDDRFDIELADRIVRDFLDRNYKPNGEGGLFTIKRTTDDLRRVEIWYQLLWYLDTIT